MGFHGHPPSPACQSPARRLDTTAGIERAPGFLATADYVRQMTAPTGEMFNFADSGPQFGFEPVLFWFARELGRRDLAELQFQFLISERGDLVSNEPRHDTSRLLPLALIWCNPTLPAARGTPPPLAWWSEGGAQPQAVLRSAWNDPRAEKELEVQSTHGVGPSSDLTCRVSLC